MSATRFPVGAVVEVTYPAFKVSLAIHSATQLSFDIRDSPFVRTETVDIDVVPLGNSRFLVSWQERDGATVVNLQDYDRGVVHSFATLPDGRFIRMTGPMLVVRPPEQPSDDRPVRNKALVLEAMTSLFQRRDAGAIDALYAHDYVQHNPEIPQGRAALKALVEGLSADVHYEPGLVVADGDFVAIHGRIRGWSAVPQVVVDVFRIEGGRLAEHWDVLQDEVPGTRTAGAWPCSTRPRQRAPAEPAT